MRALSTDKLLFSWKTFRLNWRDFNYNLHGILKGLGTVLFFRVLLLLILRRQKTFVELKAVQELISSADLFSQMT